MYKDHKFIDLKVHEYHRTFGPPSKPGHGRGSAPYDDRIRQAPVGRASWTLNNAPVANSLSETWRDALELSLGSWLSGTSLFNIAGAALVTSLPARALTWTLSRHRLNQPSIRRLEGTTSKNNELNAYGRKDEQTSLVFPPESTRRRTNQPTWFPSTKTRATHLKETNNFQPASCQQASTF